MYPFVYDSLDRAPPPPMLHDGVGGLYSPSASFQSLLANISAAQHSVHQSGGKPLPPLHSDYMTGSNAAASPPLSPVVSTASTNNNGSSGSGGGGAGNSSPSQDLRSSSIAALRLKAREHEMRLEMLRQNPNSDIIS